MYGWVPIILLCDDVTNVCSYTYILKMSERRGKVCTKSKTDIVVEKA